MTSQATVLPGPASPPLDFVAGDELVGPGASGQRFQVLPLGGLMGWLSPVAVPSSNGEVIAYNAWQEKRDVDPQKSFSGQGIATGDVLARPSIRLFNTKTGADSLVEDGAYSVAWRGDGAIAYFKGVDPDFRASTPYLGNVFVRDSVGSAPRQLTSKPDRYVVIAWAEDRLLVYRMSEGEQLDLYVIDPSAELRMLAPYAELVAVSPDGKKALVSEGGSLPSAVVRDIASGAELASLQLGTINDLSDGHPPTYLGYGGDWVGDRVVAEAGSSLLVLEVKDRWLAVDELISFQEGLFPMPLHQPRFTDGSATTVVAWVPLPDVTQAPHLEALVYTYVSCDVATLACEQGPLQRTQTFSAVENPSRPLAGAVG